MSGSISMPAGKHKGRAVEDLPSSYLRWVAENFEDDDIATAADEEYRYRTDHDCHFEDD